MSVVRAEDYQHRELVVCGWDVGVTSYRIDDRWVCKVDNVSPGAIVSRGYGETREAAENAALSRAEALLARTRRHR